MKPTSDNIEISYRQYNSMLGSHSILIRFENLRMNFQKCEKPKPHLLTVISSNHVSPYQKVISCIGTLKPNSFH